MLDSFKGEVTPFITREDVKELKLLDQAEAIIFLKELFTSDTSKGIVKVSDDKLVLYKILEQKLMSKKKVEKNRDFISTNAKNLKNAIHHEGLIKRLEALYEIKVYKGF
jgi:peptidyl-prolyl cis-trans isomerase D